MRRETEWSEGRQPGGPRGLQMRLFGCKNASNQAQASNRWHVLAQEMRRANLAIHMRRPASRRQLRTRHQRQLFVVTVLVCGSQTFNRLSDNSANTQMFSDHPLSREKFRPVEL